MMVEAVMRVLVYGDQGEDDADVQAVAQQIADALGDTSGAIAVTFRNEDGDQEVTPS
jgi:hypothetical protein